MKPLLQVNNLKKTFTISSGAFKKKVTEVHAVDDLSFHINERDTLAIIGESGCGKSTTAKCVLRLHEPTSGEVIFDGEDLVKLSREQMRLKRRDIQMIYQDPYSSLNPRMSVRRLLAEPLKAHKLASGDEINSKVEEMADMVGLSKQQLDRYPHQFSGGQRQRISIARALIMRPKLILADEPVSALDVSIQAQVLNLLGTLQEELNLTMLFISHDLNVVRHVSNYVVVMYLGKVMEAGDTQTILENPLHPYTSALLESVPGLDPDNKKSRTLLKEDAFSLSELPDGCVFANRCPKVKERCWQEAPDRVSYDNRELACFLYSE